MNIKDQLQKKKDELIENGKDQIKKSVQKLQDKEFREETARKVAETTIKITKAAAKTTAKTTDAVISEAYEYAKTNRMLPGAKEQYIAQLEAQIEFQDAEIARLRRELRRRTWCKRGR